MWALFKKEISGFFSSLTGYLVIVVFLLLNSLFMWIVPGQFNLIENGYATMDSLFAIAPWVFLFLVPAITMRMFSEEKRSGTLDLLSIGNNVFGDEFALSETENEEDWRQWSGKSPAFYGVPTANLRELADAIASDGRFVDCAVRTAWEGLMQRELQDEDWSEIQRRFPAP